MIFAYLSEAEIRVRCLSDPFVEHRYNNPTFSSRINYWSQKISFKHRQHYIITITFIYFFPSFYSWLVDCCCHGGCQEGGCLQLSAKRDRFNYFFFPLHIQVTLLAMLRLTSQNLEITSAEPSGEPHPFSLEVLLCFPPH